MAIVGLSYRYCGDGRTRYLGIDDSNGNIVGHPSAGPDPGGSPVKDDDIDFEASCEISGASLYNDGTYVVYTKATSPFATVIVLSDPNPTPDPPPVVCALLMALLTVTNASGVANADGSFRVRAIDANSSAVIKFKIGSDFTYASDGLAGSLVSGGYEYTFNLLVPGIYTIYARNSASCVRTFTVEVGVTDRYFPIYRLRFDDQITGAALAEPRYRFDIEEKDYSGAVEEVEGGGGSPVVVSWEGRAQEDPFNPIVASAINVTLNSTTDQKFLNLYTSDDRKYRGRLYEYNGSSYALKHVGFLSPMLYSEPYVQEKNYDVNFTFVDLGPLADQPFGSPTANIFIPQLLKGRRSILEGIMICLRKTGIELDVWESANLYTAAMDQTDDDSMLTQVAFDVDVYTTDTGAEDCLTVLDALLRAIGCRIYQASGRWNIELVSQKMATEVLTRKFDYNMVHLGTETLNPRLLMRRTSAPDPKVVFAEQSGFLKIAAQYGIVTVAWDLGIEEENNLLVRGDFNPEDLVNGQFTGWSVTKTGTPEVGIEQLIEERGNTDTALYVDFEGQAFNRYVEITASPIDLKTFSPAPAIRVKFDVLVRPVFKETYAFIDFALGFNNNSLLLEPGDDGKLVPQQNGNGLINSVFKRVFITEMLSWKSIDFTIPETEAQHWLSSMTGPMNLRIRIHGNNEYDLSSRSALKALVVDYSGTGRTNVHQYARVRVLDTQSGAQVIRFYVFEAAGGATADEPNIVIPNAGNDFGYWKLEKTVPRIGSNNWIKQILTTNVQVSYLPGSANPTETVSSSEIVDFNVRRNYKQTIRHGDIFTTILMDGNYRYLTNRWLSYLSDGEPLAGGWYRKGVTEEKFLHQMLAVMYKGQFAIGRWHLSGSLENNGAEVSLYNTFHELRTGRVYMAQSMQVDYRQRLFNAELIEALKGEAVVDEGDVEPPVIEPPVSTREHTEEFTAEFS